MPHPFTAKGRRAALPVTALLLLVFSATAVFASGNRQKLPEPGFRSIGVWDAQTGFRMDVAAWYPSPRPSRDVHLDGWFIRVSKDYSASPGKYPVILISHGSAGGRLSSHDLAAHLARHGFIVIAPTHPGDNDRDTDALFSAENFAARPRHIIAAFKSAANHPVIGPLMDHERIGLLGVGSGAATMLQLAGASPNLSLLASYCPPDSAYIPLCSNWAKSFHAGMAREFSALRAGHGTEYFTPFFPSVLAIGLLTPGLISLFPEESLRSLSVPVGIMAAENDTLYPPSGNVTRLLELLPQRPASRVLQNANHYDLRPPCPPIYKENFPGMCGDPGPLAADHRKIRNDFFVRFFQKLLGPPLFPEPEPQTKTAAKN